MGLEYVLQKRGKEVSGIVNGINTDEWNPETDPFIPSRFSAQILRQISVKGTLAAASWSAAFRQNSPFDRMSPGWPTRKVSNSSQKRLMRLRR